MGRLLSSDMFPSLIGAIVSGILHTSTHPAATVAADPSAARTSDLRREQAQLSEEQRYTEFYNKVYKRSNVWVRFSYPGDPAGSTDFGLDVRLAVLPARDCPELATLNCLDPMPKQRRFNLADVHGQICCQPSRSLVPMETLEFLRSVPIMRPAASGCGTPSGLGGTIW